MLYIKLKGYVGASLFVLLMCLLTSVHAQSMRELNFATPVEPRGLDPALNRSALTTQLTYQNIFEGLTQIDRNNNVMPSLAHSWKIDKSGLFYTFTLRKNILFHDNSKLTATIVKASLERTIRLSRNNKLNKRYNNIKNITVVSQYVLTIELAWPDSYFLYDLGLANAVIQHPNSWENNYKTPIGTGPYRFVSWKRNNSISLVANYQYWGALANIKNINVFFAQKDEQIMDAFSKGALDGYANISEMQEWKPYLDVRQDYRLNIGNASGKIILALNHENKMLAAKEVRQSIAKAIDKKSIAKAFDSIIGDEIGSHYSPNDVDYIDLSQAYPYSVGDAKLLSTKPGITLTALTLISPPKKYAQIISKQVQEMLRAAGIVVTIEEVSWKEWLSRVYEERDYDLTVIAYSDPHDLDIYAYNDYYFNYQNDEYKEVIRKIKRSQIGDARSKLLQQAQQMLSDDVANIYLFMLPNVAIWHEKLQGYWKNQAVPAMIFSQMYWQQ